jgi:hypothetical protein
VVLAVRSSTPDEGALVIRFVTINKFCELTGYTRRAVEGKRQSGVWPEGGVIVKALDGHILVDIEAFNRWAESGAMSSAPRIGGPQRSALRPQFEPPEPRRRRRPKEECA